MSPMAAWAVLSQAEDSASARNILRIRWDPLIITTSQLDNSKGNAAPAGYGRGWAADGGYRHGPARRHRQVYAIARCRAAHGLDSALPGRYFDLDRSGRRPGPAHNRADSVRRPPATRLARRSPAGARRRG